MLTRLTNLLPAVRRAHADLRAVKAEFERYRKFHGPTSPARITIDKPMSEAEIEENLIGTQTLPVVRAINALIGNKLVELSDSATERPRQPQQTDLGLVAGYSADERMHDSGGSAALADLLSRIQDMSRPKSDEEVASRAA